MTSATERHISWHALTHFVTSNPQADGGRHRSDDHEAGVRETGDAEVELYEDDGNVVLFDAMNPLAWVEASRTVRLTDAA